MGIRCLLAAFATVLAVSATPLRADEVAEVSFDARNPSDAEVDAVAAKLRARGPDGLRAALDAYGRWQSAEAAKSYDSTDSVDRGEAKWRRLIDRVAQQKDADVSRLYWHTDWASAQDEARRTGKPVLRLFMMGRLTDNLSCANSRFFRVALYANEQVSALLRDHYVLCWTSVRPVPTIKVDFGDGRTLERTVTGNSIHYVVDADGQLIDALPGLVGPADFLAWLDGGLAKHFEATMHETDAAKRTSLRSLHERTYSRLLAEWRTALDQVAPPYPTEQPYPTEPPSAAPSPPGAAWGPTVPAAEPTVRPAPDAIDAAPLAISKAFVELPLAREVVNAPTAPTAIEAAPLSTSKLRVEAPLVQEIVAPAATPPTTAPPANPPTAIEAAPVSKAKRAVEAPLVAEVVADRAPPAAEPPAAPTTVHVLTALDALPLAFGKGRVEQPLVAQFAAPAPGAPAALQLPGEPSNDPIVGTLEPVATTSTLPPQALAAMRLAGSKSDVEAPLVAAVTVDRDDVPGMTAATTDRVWDLIAVRFIDVCRLDDSSRRLMDRLHADPTTSPDATCPSSTVESFERAMALDTARNQYLLRRTILEWLIDDGQPADVVAFNGRVYDELFLTPSSDPWVGLVPAGVFTGIEAEGLFGGR